MHHFLNNKIRKRVRNATKNETHTDDATVFFRLKKNTLYCLLFYRLGDFYELFYDDAIEAARLLEITLTSRNKNAEDPIPMCGVPHHAAKEYIKTLIELGKKVAICEQLEDPKLTKGMVKRDVVQVLTPGTYTEYQAQNQNHYLVSILPLVGETICTLVCGCVNRGN